MELTDEEINRLVDAAANRGTNPQDLCSPFLIEGTNKVIVHFGLSKREMFSAMVLQGLVVPAIPGFQNHNNKNEVTHKAEMAVRLADALIKELNKVEE